jgi:hypothetical protein
MNPEMDAAGTAVAAEIHPEQISLFHRVGTRLAFLAMVAAGASGGTAYAENGDTGHDRGFHRAAITESEGQSAGKTTLIAQPTTEAVKPSEGPRRKKGYILWQGDSLLGQYNNNPHSILQGFDSVVDNALGYRTKEIQRGGSGYVRQGKKHPNHIKPSSMQKTAENRVYLADLWKSSQAINSDNDYCEEGVTDNVLDREKTKKAQKLIKHAAKVMMEPGINDRNKCDENGNLVPLAKGEFKANAEASFDIIDSLRDYPESVYIMLPGNNGEGGIVKKNAAILRKLAKQHGYNFINVFNVLGPKNTIDGIHPNRKGVLKLARAVIYRSNLKHELVNKLPRK